MTAILTAEGLSKSFGTVVAVDDLTLSVEPGEVFGLVGPDGAGKSTALRLLCGVLDADRGHTIIEGRNVVNPQDVAIRIGYMPQQFALAADLTVRENIEFTAELFGIAHRDIAPRIDELLGFTGLAPFAKRRSGKLSGGMKRKLSLICALVHQPPLLLLDEPTSGVDPSSRRDFWELLHRLAREGIALVVTTTYMEEAERCHRVGLLYAGRLVLCDTPAALRAGVGVRVLEVWCEQRDAVCRSLTSMPDVDDALVTGDRLRVFLKPDAGAPEALIDAAVRNGAQIQHWAEAQPTIGDVFLRFLKEKNAAVGARRAVP